MRYLIEAQRKDGHVVSYTTDQDILGEAVMYYNSHIKRLGDSNVNIFEMKHVLEVKGSNVIKPYIGRDI